MKRTRFTEEQIVAILKQSEAGMKTMEVCRQNGISEATFYNWKAKYGGMAASDVHKLQPHWVVRRSCLCLSIASGRASAWT